MKYGGIGGHFGRMICICTGLVGPISSKYTFFPRILLFQEGTISLKRKCRRAKGAVFEVILGSVWVSVGDFVSLDGHFALMVESLWVY